MRTTHSWSDISQVQPGAVRNGFSANVIYIIQTNVEVCGCYHPASATFFEHSTSEFAITPLTPEANRSPVAPMVQYWRYPDQQLVIDHRKNKSKCFEIIDHKGNHFGRKGKTAKQCEAEFSIPRLMFAEAKEIHECSEQRYLELKSQECKPKRY